jgi:hypothetical protein
VTPRTITLALLSAALLGACATSVGPSGRGGPTGGPFDREELVLCDARTTGLGVHTMRGGRMTVRLVSSCPGVASCEAPDELAPGAWTTIRVAGREILVGGCVIDALGGTDLEVTFRSESGADEVYELPVSGACVDPGSGCVRDSGPPPTSDAGLDAGDTSEAGA